MRTRIIDAGSLEAVAPAALRAYIVFEGWERTGSFREVSALYKKTIAGKAHELIAPDDNRIGDYAAAVAQVIEYLARMEQRDQLEIYRDLTQSGRDVIRVRTTRAEEDGSVELNLGVELVQHARDLLAAAACAAHEPRRTYHVGKIEAANEYMRRVSLGQTERGSFVVTLLAPVPPALTQSAQASLWPVMDTEPFDRQVTRTLANALTSVREAMVASNRGDGLQAFEDAVAKGVSANLCEAVAQIVERGDGADLSVTWARTRPTPEQRTRAQFSRDDSGILREVARYFRLKEPQRDVELFGVITKLNREESDFDGKVTLKTSVDGRLRSLSVDFAQADYERALEAHRKKVPVLLRGNLVMKGQRWQLLDPRELQLLDTDADETSSEEAV